MNVNISDNLVYEWVRFFKGQVYEWGMFQNTGSNTLTTINPKLPPRGATMEEQRSGIKFLLLEDVKFSNNFQRLQKSFF